MNIRLILLTFWLTSNVFSLIQAQNTFIKSFDPNPQDMYVFDKGANIWSFDNYLYVVNGYVNAQGGRSQQLFKIDATSKEIIKQIAMEGPQGDLAISERGGYCLTADGNVLLTGEWRDYTATRMRTFIAKLDKDLNLIWINYYPELSSLHVYGDAIAETSSGDILLYITEGAPTMQQPWLSSQGQLRIVRTDPLGQLIFNKIVPDTFNLTFGYGHLTRADDGNFLLSSTVYGYYYDPIFGTYFYNAIVHKIDSNGIPIWSQVINYNQFGIQAPVSTALPDGGGAVMWSRDTFASDPNIAFEVNELHRFNSAGHTLWTHEWNYKAIRTVYRIITATNGDIIGCGYYSKDGGKGKTWLFRSTEDGNILWERHYSDSIQRPWSPQLEMLDLCEMADGRIAAAGIVFDTTTVGSLNSNVGVLVLDPNGCLLPDCAGLPQYITGYVEPGSQSPSLPQLICLPNPASRSLSINLPHLLGDGYKKQELRCYDARGNLVSNIKWINSNKEQQIDVGSWLPGVYQLVYWVDTRPVFSGKIIVQH